MAEVETFTPRLFVKSEIFEYKMQIYKHFLLIIEAISDFKKNGQHYQYQTPIDSTSLLFPFSTFCLLIIAKHSYKSKLCLSCNFAI